MQMLCDVLFCVYVLFVGDMMVIQDVLNDDCFYDNLFVIGVFGICFYVGWLFIVLNGVFIGMLCLIDMWFCLFEFDEFVFFGDFVYMIECEIVVLYFVMIDEFMQFMNWCGFEIFVCYVLCLCDCVGCYVVLLFFDLNGFKVINDCFGYVEGDCVFKVFVDMLMGVLCDSDVIVWFGGDEFVVLLSVIDLVDVIEFVECVMQVFVQCNVVDVCGYVICFSVGYVVYDFVCYFIVVDLFVLVDCWMYEYKQCDKMVGV